MVENKEQKLEALIAIMDAGLEDVVLDIYEEFGVAVSFLTYGYGTIRSKIYEMLGYGGPRKIINLALMTERMSRLIMDRIDGEIDLSRPGTGVAMTISLSSVSKMFSEASLKADNNLEMGSGNMLRAQKEPYQLVIAIVNSGHFDKVMEAAKEAGAGGGTIIHARSLGSKEAVKYLGIIVQPEKDLVLILAKKKDRLRIMEAITNVAGLDSPAAGCCFSLPVNDVMGVDVVMSDFGIDSFSADPR